MSHCCERLDTTLLLVCALVWRDGSLGRAQGAYSSAYCPRAQRGMLRRAHNGALQLHSADAVPSERGRGSATSTPHTAAAAAAAADLGSALCQSWLLALGRTRSS